MESLLDDAERLVHANLAASPLNFAQLQVRTHLDPKTLRSVLFRLERWGLVRRAVGEQWRTVADAAAIARARLARCVAPLRHDAERLQLECASCARTFTLLEVVSDQMRCPLCDLPLQACDDAVGALLHEADALLA